MCAWQRHGCLGGTGDNGPLIAPTGSACPSQLHISGISEVRISPWMQWCHVICFCQTKVLVKWSGWKMKGVYNICKASVMSNHQVNAIWMVQVASPGLKIKLKCGMHIFACKTQKAAALGLESIFFFDTGRWSEQTSVEVGPLATEYSPAIFKCTLDIGVDLKCFHFASHFYWCH